MKKIWLKKQCIKRNGMGHAPTDCPAVTAAKEIVLRSLPGTGSTE